MLGNIEGRRSAAGDMRRLNSITDSMDMSLSKLLGTVKDRDTWSAAVHRVTESDTTEGLNEDGKTSTSPEAPDPTSRLTH